MMKALESGADAVIFDLEDSVAPAQKAIARELLACCPTAATADPSAGSGSIRSAPTIIATTSTLLEDLDIDGVVLPKAECGDDVADLAAALAPRSLPIHAIVTETAASLFGLLSYRDCCSSLAADELGRGGFVGGARRVVQIFGRRRPRLHLPAGPLAVPGRRGRGRSAAGRRRVRRLPRRSRADRGGARRGVGRLHRQARHPSGPGRRRSTPPSRRRPRKLPMPRRSSKRSRQSPTPASCRWLEKWSTVPISFKRGAYWPGPDRRLNMATTAQPEPATTSETTAGRRRPRAWGTEASDQPLVADGDRAPRAPARRRRDQDHPLRHLPQRPPHCRNDWGMSRYPVVPGHEIVGIVTASGPTSPNTASATRSRSAAWSTAARMRQCQSGMSNSAVKGAS